MVSVSQTLKRAFCAVSRPVVRFCAGLVHEQHHDKITDLHLRYAAAKQGNRIDLDTGQEYPVTDKKELDCLRRHLAEQIAIHQEIYTERAKRFGLTYPPMPTPIRG